MALIKGRPYEENIAVGLYKEESTNQRMFCIKVCSKNMIKTWFEDMQGNNEDPWWNMNIAPSRFEWLVGEWNNGNVEKTYPHYLEKADTRRKHITSLLQLDWDSFLDVLNYASYILPHSKWALEN